MSPAVILAALAAVVIWGASAVGAKLAIADFPPLALAALRTCLAAPLALALALALRVRLPPLHGARSQWGLLALSAGCGFIFFPLVFSFAIATTSATHAAMILALLPVFTGAIAQAWDGRLPHRNWWTGCALALAGEALLVLARDPHGQASLSGDALATLAGLFAATGYVAGGRLKQAGYPSQGATYWGVSLASLALLPALPWMLHDTPWASAAPSAWAGLLYVAFGVTIAGYVLWYWALGQGGIARVGMFQFLQPVSGVLLAALLLGEPLSPSLGAATLAILGGVWIATRPVSRTP